MIAFSFHNTSVKQVSLNLAAALAVIVSLIFPGQSVAQKLSAEYLGEGITIREGKDSILRFQYQPKSFNGQYERAGYIHPLYGLKGEVLTEDMPEDHPYHRGIFWAWHQVLVDGKKVADSWMSENITWKPGVIDIRKHKGSLQLSVYVQWKILSGKDTLDLLKEHTLITVYAKKENARMIDFDINLVPVIPRVSIGGAENEKGYGGFCLRLCLPPDILFNSQGMDIIPQENAITAGSWMNFTGSFAGSNKPRAGIVAIAAPGSGSAEQRWILRKEKSMQNIVDPGNQPAQIPEQGWQRKYRLVVHDGTLTTEQINSFTETFYNLK